MCGLFAGIGKLNSGRMIALGSMNEERGIDSVGLAYMQNGKIEVAKVAERPCVALNTTLRKQVTEAAVSGMFIGHTRQATQGKVTDRNAHPFLIDDIVFAHNGIIMNDWEFGEYEVDSESLIHGIKEKDFSKYEGPVALVWIQDSKLKAYRCGNPLYRGRHNGTLYLASDEDYLKAAGCTGIKQLSEGLIYTFNNAMLITTERVQKNKLWGRSKTTSSIYEDYCGGKLGMSYIDKVTEKGHVLTPAERQANWWDEEKRKDADEIKKEEAEEAIEDFRTMSDIERERAKAYAMTSACDICGEHGEITDDGYCLACVMWMRDNGVNENDIPPSCMGAIK